jgi:hypothetical protein
VNEASSQLTAIWDEVGFSESERAVQMEELVLQVGKICDEKVADEEAVRETFLSSIEENRARITDNAARLGESAPNLDVDDEGHDISKLALTEQLVFFEQLGAALEKRTFPFALPHTLYLISVGVLQLLLQQSRLPPSHPPTHPPTACLL